MKTVYGFIFFTKFNYDLQNKPQLAQTNQTTSFSMLHLMFTLFLCLTARMMKQLNFSL